MKNWKPIFDNNDGSDVKWLLAFEFGIFFPGLLKIYTWCKYTNLKIKSCGIVSIKRAEKNKAVQFDTILQPACGTWHRGF